MQQANRACLGLISRGKLDRPHGAGDARDQHPLGPPPLEQIEAALDPLRAAGQDDDRVGARSSAGRGSSTANKA